MEDRKIVLKQHFSNAGIKMQHKFWFWEELGIKYLGG